MLSGKWMDREGEWSEKEGKMRGKGTLTAGR